MKQLLTVFSFLFIGTTLIAQTKLTQRIDKYADLAFTVGSSQGSVAFSYMHNWKLGKKQKWQIGFGGRLTSYFGTKRDYTTAGPARLTRSNSIPFLIFFAGQETQNWDTLNVQRPFTNSLNATINFGYQLNRKLSAGFNIDLIGVTIGRKTSGILTTNGTTRSDASVKPSVFNLLLTGDHDLGSLNSEFFLRYQLSNKWSVRGVYQFHFSEYQTTSIKQIAPDRTQIDRFRNKVNAFGIGVSRHF